MIHSASCWWWVGQRTGERNRHRCSFRFGVVQTPIWTELWELLRCIFGGLSSRIAINNSPPLPGLHNCRGIIEYYFWRCRSSRMQARPARLRRFVYFLSLEYHYQSRYIITPPPSTHHINCSSKIPPLAYTWWLQSRDTILWSNSNVIPELVLDLYCRLPYHTTDNILHHTINLLPTFILIHHHQLSQRDEEIKQEHKSQSSTLSFHLLPSTYYLLIK